MTNLSFRDIILQDFWVHLAGIIAIALGAGDIVYFHALSHDSDLLFIIGGFGAMGLKFVNGSAAALRTAALDTAFNAARVAQVAAAATTGQPIPPLTAPTIPDSTTTGGTTSGT
jgi:hypothetical protein